MAQFIEGPAVTRDMINLGMPSRSVGGAQEIHYDSSQMRAAYESSANGGMPTEAGPVMGPMPGMGGPNVELPVDMEGLDPAILKALTAGQPPPANLMPGPKMPMPAPMPPTPQGGYAPPSPAATVMTLPLGGGVTAQVIFTGKTPKARHWQRLIKHMQIEAEEMEADNAEADREAADEAAAADLLRQAIEGLAAQQRERAQSGGEDAGIARPVKRRVRKNERGTPAANAFTAGEVAAEEEAEPLGEIPTLGEETE